MGSLTRGAAAPRPRDDEHVCCDAWCFHFHGAAVSYLNNRSNAMIRRRGGAPPEEESSSDEEDAFSALSSRKAKPPAKAKSAPTDTAASAATNSGTTKPSQSFPVSNTSSMKRHHGTSGSRKAKMDALLQELEVEKATASTTRRGAFVPEKKGSFVQPGEEHLTTNIFVGNLAPSITEEQLTDLFRQFGEALVLCVACDFSCLVGAVFSSFLLCGHSTVRCAVVRQ